MLDCKKKKVEQTSPQSIPDFRPPCSKMADTDFTLYTGGLNCEIIWGDSLIIFEQKIVLE